jgi:hypothetical protein
LDIAIVVVYTSSLVFLSILLDAKQIVRWYYLLQNTVGALVAGAIGITARGRTISSGNGLGP